MLAALLKPTLEVMYIAGIARLSIEEDGRAVLQMREGDVVTIEPR